jgi:hypothetical protein
MAVVIFGPALVNARETRVVDRGSGMTPRLVVEIQAPPDAMGGIGWGALGGMDSATFDALMLAAGIIH